MHLCVPTIEAYKSAKAHTGDAQYKVGAQKPGAALQVQGAVKSLRTDVSGCEGVTPMGLGHTVSAHQEDKSPWHGNKLRRAPGRRIIEPD